MLNAVEASRVPPLISNAFTTGLLLRERCFDCAQHDVLLTKGCRANYAGSDSM